MLKKCTEVISKLPSSHLLTQRALLKPINYRFSLGEKERNKQNPVGKDRTEAETLKLKNIHFSTVNSTQKGQQRVSENWSEEGTFELSLEQKLYFIQAAGFLFLANILVRLSMDNKNHIDSYQRKL